MKNNYKYSVVLNHLALAKNLLYLESVSGDGIEEGESAAHDYPLYKVLREMPLDDVSLSFLPFFSDFPYSMESVVPFERANAEAFFGNGDYWQLMHKADSLQVEAFRNMTGMEGMPWAMQ